MTRLGMSPGYGLVKVRAAGNGAKNTTGQLSVPAHMARMLPNDAWFKPEWHEDGLLYRFVGAGDDIAPPVPGDLPAWTNGSRS
jgi:hypothetical protein